METTLLHIQKNKSYNTKTEYYLVAFDDKFQFVVVSNKTLMQCKDFNNKSDAYDYAYNEIQSVINFSKLK